MTSQGVRARMAVMRRDISAASGGTTSKEAIDASTAGR